MFSLEELGLRLLDPRIQALCPTRLPHEQRIAQMVSDLSVHDGNGVRREGQPTFAVETLCGLDEPDACHLKEVLIVLGRAREPLERVMKELLVPLQEVFQGLQFAFLVPGDELFVACRQDPEGRPLPAVVHRCRAVVRDGRAGRARPDRLPS